MTVECVTCERFSLRGAPLARSGFGLCEAKNGSVNVSATFPRKCKDHAAADGGLVEKRRVWLVKAAA